MLFAADRHSTTVQNEFVAMNYLGRSVETEQPFEHIAPVSGDDLRFSARVGRDAARNLHAAPVTDSDCVSTDKSTLYGDNATWKETPPISQRDDGAAVDDKATGRF